MSIEKTCDKLSEFTCIECEVSVSLHVVDVHPLRVERDAGRAVVGHHLHHLRQ